MKYIIPTLLMAVITAVQSQTPEPVIPDDPAEAAKAFYTEIRQRKLSGLPTGMTWVALAPRVTEELAIAIRGAQAEQAEFIKENPGEKPPWIEGDLFSSLFEGPQKFEIGKAKVTGDTAEVPVSCIHTEGSDTAKWTDTLLLKKTAKGWLVDDLQYGGTWDFSSQGNLKQSLAPEAG